MKIVFVVSRFPYPLEKGDKLRAYQHIVNLFESGHQIKLIALSDCEVSNEALDKLKQYCDEIKVLPLSKWRLFLNLSLTFFRNLPLQIGYFYSIKHKSIIRKEISDYSPDLLYCQLIRTALFVKDINSIAKVLDYQDAFSKGTLQRMNKAPVLMKWLFKREYKLVCRVEKHSYNWFNSHFIIAEQDRQWLKVNNDLPITVLPNSIDTEFYKPVESKHEFDITFTGNMNYPPNVDAAVFLINEIMPLVWKKIPDARVQIGGANPGSKVKALGSSKVIITGWVDDIRDCYKNSKVFIAPMRIGTGLQNKLLEAMSMQVPSITTPLSFEPVGAKSDSEILVGSNSSELASLIIQLLNDEIMRKKIGAAGREFVKNKYSIQSSRTVLNSEFISVLTKFNNS